jgi:hypothetical protein
MEHKEYPELERVLPPEYYQKFKNMSPASKISFLQIYSSSIDQMNPTYMEIQKCLFDMEQEERLDNPMERAMGVTPPERYDVLITDINDSHLSQIGMELSFNRLQETTSLPIFPVKGILFGPSLRIFLPLIIEKKGKRIQVLFLFDTGSPNTYLRTDTFEALGYTEFMPDEANVFIHDLGLTVYKSRGHFENVDLLGQDFMRGCMAKVSIDYNKLTAVVTK